MRIFKKIIELEETGKTAVLATVVETTGSTPREAGARMLILDDGSTFGTVGGGAIEKAVVDEAGKLLKTGGNTLFRETLKDMGMYCGGGMTVYLETLNPPERLVIFGGGHIGQILSKFAKSLGFHVTVIDNREEIANRQNLPDADDIICLDYAAALEQVTLLQSSYIVILTHKHTHDYEVLESCIERPHRYLGMIGSKSKVATCLCQLEEKGISKELITSIHSPIGLKIGGQTPAEIAISIAAELISVRHQ